MSLSSHGVEEWRPVECLGGAYEVSSLGRVKRATPSKGATPGYVLKLRLNHNGYQVVRLGRPDRNYRVHRLVADAFLPPRVAGQEVNHKNGIKTDNSATNLEWLTRKQNVQHAIVTGLRTAAPSCIQGYSDSQIAEVRAALQAGASQYSTAKKFGMARSQVWRISRGYRSVSGSG